VHTSYVHAHMHTYTHTYTYGFRIIQILHTSFCFHNGNYSILLKLLFVDQTFVVNCTYVTSSYLWVETGLHGHVPTLRHFFIFSPLASCFFLSFSPPSSSYIFLKTCLKSLKTCLTNQKARTIMAFGTG
jgi:hypothetical protein